MATYNLVQALNTRLASWGSYEQLTNITQLEAGAYAQISQFPAALVYKPPHGGTSAT